MIIIGQIGEDHQTLSIYFEQFLSDEAKTQLKRKNGQVQDSVFLGVQCRRESIRAAVQTLAADLNALAAESLLDGGENHMTLGRMEDGSCVIYFHANVVVSDRVLTLVKHSKECFETGKWFGPPSDPQLPKQQVV